MRTDVGGVREVRGVTARPKARRIGQVVAAGDDDTHRVGVGAVPIANVRIQTGLVAGIELGDGVVGIEHVRGVGGRIPLHVEAKGVGRRHRLVDLRLKIGGRTRLRKTRHGAVGRLRHIHQSIVVKPGAETLLLLDQCFLGEVIVERHLQAVDRLGLQYEPAADALIVGVLLIDAVVLDEPILDG